MNTKKLITFLSLITYFSLSIVLTPQIPVDIPSPTGITDDFITIM